MSDSDSKNAKGILQRSFPTVMGNIDPGPLMGVCLIEDLLKFPLKSLYITGMDGYASAPEFFKTGRYPEYVDNYLHPNARVYRDTYLEGQPTGHDNVRDANFILEFVRKDSRCTIDPTYFKLIQKIANKPNRKEKKI